MIDLHTHTVWSDGRDTAEEMIQEALGRGMTCIGISDHSFAEWDDAAMPRDSVHAYRREISRLKAAYDGKIEVLCGLERDYYSGDQLEYDYVIGSVHAMRMENGHHVCVDWTPERLERDCATFFGGDWYALCEAFYRLEADVVRRTKCDIIGHFDLVTKFNEARRWFDPAHPRYRAAWQAAADQLLKTGKLFEINTGAMSRGYRTDAYPAREIRDYLRSAGARLILSSDAHRKEHLAFAFDRFAAEQE